mmetsp:Transcript_26635/g.42226  ORF Transcript_26635/g.42226 Transcript_26635/m.42226 type:complete len:224 (-) Transcript_26635:91-762(-)
MERGVSYVAHDDDYTGKLADPPELPPDVDVKFKRRNLFHQARPREHTIDPNPKHGLLTSLHHLFGFSLGPLRPPWVAKDGMLCRKRLIGFIYTCRVSIDRVTGIFLAFVDFSVVLLDEERCEATLALPFLHGVPCVDSASKRCHDRRGTEAKAKTRPNPEPQPEPDFTSLPVVRFFAKNKTRLGSAFFPPPIAWVACLSRVRLGLPVILGVLCRLPIGSSFAL